MVDVGPLGPVNPRTGTGRIAVYPDGRAPAGVCPVCGQEDPDGLDVDGCHWSCLEWLNFKPESLTDRFADPDLIQKPKRQKPPRSYPTRGGYMSSDRTIHDLGPFPEAWMRKPQPPPGPGAGSPTTR